MKIKEIIIEGTIFDSDIRAILMKNGYTYLGSGADQHVYLAPDNTVLKIFGYNRLKNKKHQSFIDFANYCMKNSNNPFLPQFYGWKKFEFKGKTYLQIKCERLFEFNSDVGAIASKLSVIADYVTVHGPKLAYKYFLEKYYDDPFLLKDEETSAQLTMLLGDENAINLFAKTISDLNIIAKKEGYALDLHSDNFMLGSDGEIVINDPFY